MTQTTCAASCVRGQQNVLAETDDGCVNARYVAAGDACGTDCAGYEAEPDMALATVYVHPQTYRTGYCPAEALGKGTLFPELVSPYTRGC